MQAARAIPGSTRVFHPSQVPKVSCSPDLVCCQAVLKLPFIMLPKMLSFLRFSAAALARAISAFFACALASAAYLRAWLSSIM